MSACILVVDDEQQVRDVVRRKMEQSGYSVGEATNGDEAIRKLAGSRFDLVIADILMPERDGLEVIMYLREHQPEVKIIAISAPGNEVFLKSAAALGAARTFSKPFSMDALAAAVCELV
jgi:CheY-like chemotaxis protein